MARADSVSDATGVSKLILTLRYHEQSRQWFAIIFVLLVSLLGQPQDALLYAGTVIAFLV